MTALPKSFGAASNLQLVAMFSLEPFTLRDIGSPQVFQTGETFNGAPLIDYQHPHDLIMNLGGDLSRARSVRRTVIVAAYAVGPAPLGPPVFMHRPSATENPQAPLSHHYLDASHITPGVVSIGVERSDSRSEAGAFHGREPDEDRLDLDTAALDSYGVRASWADGPWSFQISGGDLKTPGAQVAVRARRVTASASYLQGRRASIARVDRGVRPEPRSVRQPRGVSVRSDAATPARTRSTRAPRPLRKTFSTPAFIRSAWRIRIASRRSARSRRLHPRLSRARPGARFGIGGDITGYYGARQPRANRMARRCHFTSSCATAAAPARGCITCIKPSTFDLFHG